MRVSVVRRSSALAAVAAALSLASLPAAAPAARATSVPTVSIVVQATRSVEDAVRAMGGRITHDLPLISGFSARVPARDVPAIERMPGVAGVMPDLPVHVQSTPGTYDNLPSVYAKTTGGVALSNAGANGQGVTVALIDTGVTPMPDIASALVPVGVLGATQSCVNFTDEPTCDDSYGHGTFMAGIIAGNGSASGGKYVGMAPRAKILSIKIAGRSGAADVSTILAALQWVVQNKAAYGIRVLNLSLGTDSTQSYTIDPLDYAVEQAWKAGIVVDVAASNRGPAAGTISKPADDPFVITVGAIDDRGTNGLNDDTLPNFTGRGPTAADGLAKPDVVAPGAHLVSLAAPNAVITQQFPTTMPAPYRRGSGTSMATAVVSGLVAQMLSANPLMSPDRVKYALMATAHPDASSDRMAVGAGIVDGAAALNAPPGVANVGVAPSLGTGSLAASRGTVGVVLDDTNQTVLDASSGGLLANLQTLDTSGGSWWGGSWWGGSWWGGSWWGGSWWGGSWWGGSWWGQPESVDDYGGSWWGGSWWGAWDQ